MGQGMNWQRNEFLDYFYLVLFLNCIFSTFKQKHKITNTKYNALKFLELRGICSTLWLLLWNPFFIAWGRLNWNIVHRVNGLRMSNMLIKMHLSTRSPEFLQSQFKLDIIYPFFHPQVISIFYLKFFNCSETYNANWSPASFGLRHQCILPSIFAFAQ